jgi:hypothetical protein
MSRDQDQDLSPMAPVALRRRREETIRTLCDHFAADHLEAEELEQLIDAAHAATAITQLEALVADLPDLSTATSVTEADGARIAPSGAAREHAGIIACMGGSERKGVWTPARNNYVLAVMGGVVLDFREALMDPGVTEVYVLALMGGVEIIVPPGLRVDSTGIGIMGGFEHVGNSRFPVDMSVPILRVIGAGIMGGVEITERQRGESARDAKRRIRGKS